MASTDNVELLRTLHIYYQQIDDETQDLTTKCELSDELINLDDFNKEENNEFKISNEMIDILKNWNIRTKRDKKFDNKYKYHVYYKKCNSQYYDNCLDELVTELILLLNKFYIYKKTIKKWNEEMSKDFNSIMNHKIMTKFTIENHNCRIDIINKTKKYQNKIEDRINYILKFENIFIHFKSLIKLKIITNSNKYCVINQEELKNIIMKEEKTSLFQDFVDYTEYYKKKMNELNCNDYIDDKLYLLYENLKYLETETILKLIEIKINKNEI